MTGCYDMQCAVFLQLNRILNIQTVSLSPSWNPRRPQFAIVSQGEPILKDQTDECNKVTK